MYPSMITEDLAAERRRDMQDRACRWRLARPARAAAATRRNRKKTRRRVAGPVVPVKQS